MIFFASACNYFVLFSNYLTGCIDSGGFPPSSVCRRRVSDSNSPEFLQLLSVVTFVVPFQSPTVFYFHPTTTDLAGQAISRQTLGQRVEVQPPFSQLTLTTETIWSSLILYPYYLFHTFVKTSNSRCCLRLLPSSFQNTYTKYEYVGWLMLINDNTYCHHWSQVLVH